MDGPGHRARLFEEMVRSLPLAAAMFDRDLRFLAHNRRWIATHGSDDTSDLTGRRLYDVYPQIGEAWTRLHAACLSGDPATGEVDPFVRADGQVECLRWTVVPWGEEPGTVDGIVIYSEAITEEVKTRRQLAERESLVRDLFERSSVGLNLCKMDGLWLESNQAFCDIIGYSQEEADGGLTYWQLTPRRYDAMEAVQLDKLRTTRRYGPYEKEFVRKDGRLVPVRLNGFLVEREGETYIWSLIEDLTAQRALEADLEVERLKAIQSAKLATVGEMAAGIAHELNNPLGIIDAYAFALEDARTRGDDSDADQALKAIREAVVRAGKIVHGLRKFTRQSRSEVQEDVEVESIVDEAVGLTSGRVRNHGVDLVVDVVSSAHVRGCSIELGQVLVNLLNNAVDAVRGSDVRWIRLTVAAGPGAEVAISVEDSGPGVPRELVGDLFRAFFTTKVVGEGTGLGLSISRSIVERHGGTLTYDADAPHSRFVVVLPRSTP